MFYKLLAALVLCALVAVGNGGRVLAISSVVISEVQTTGCKEFQLSDPSKCAVDDGGQEFVELHNTGLVDVDVSGWRVEYLSSTHTGVSAPTRVIAELQGKITAGSHALLSSVGYVANADTYFGTAGFSGYLAKSGGHVRLVDGGGTTLDLLAWGTGVVIQNWPKVTEVLSGGSSKRLLPTDPLYNAATPFVNSAGITPQAGGLLPWRCANVVLSEIAPNPTGADGGQEFVELHNPTTEPLPLRGCNLRLGSDGPSFAFTDQTLAPGEYRAFSDQETGITLPNSAGGTIWLLLTEVEQGIEYPADMPEGSTWGLINGVWKASTLPTPGLLNQLPALPNEEGGESGGEDTPTPLPCPAGKYRNPETNRCRALPTVHSPKPCRSDQIRNPGTNRCRLKTSASATLAACKPGQVRNPETNRCRSTTTSALSSLKPCKPGQVRNTETNRCRSTATLTSTLKPCKATQERSPETNRCRNVTASGKATYRVEKTPAAPEAPVGWWVAGAAGVGASGYGIYEWRREISGFLRKLTGKSGGEPPM